MTTRTIPMDQRTQEFFKGVASGNEVIEAHEAVDFPDYQTRVRTYWFFVGALAAGKHGLEEDFDQFVLGAKQREPQDPDREQVNLLLDAWHNGDATASATLIALTPLIRKD